MMSKDQKEIYYIVYEIICEKYCVKLYVMQRKNNLNI